MKGTKIDWTRVGPALTTGILMLLGLAVLERLVLARRTVQLTIRGSVRLQDAGSGEGTQIEILLPGLRRRLRADSRFLAGARTRRVAGHPSVGSPWSHRHPLATDTPAESGADEDEPGETLSSSPTPRPRKGIRVWVPQQDPAYHYDLRWHEDGGYELDVTLSSKSAPATCSLTFRKSGYQDYHCPPFALESSLARNSKLSGDAPDVVLVPLRPDGPPPPR